MAELADHVPVRAAGRQRERASRRDPDQPPLPRYAIGHGTHDPVIGVEWGRRAHELLEGAGAEVLYHESPMPHTIDPRFVVELREWLAGTIPAWQRS